MDKITPRAMMASAVNRTVRALLAHAAARPALRRRARSLIAGVPVLQALVSRVAGLAQRDMIAAASPRGLPWQAGDGVAPGFDDRQRLHAAARAVAGKYRLPPALPGGGEGRTD